MTNSISIALEASSNPNYNVILVGGSVNIKYQFTYGNDTLRQLKKYHADKLILSVDGVDVESGFTTYYHKESAIDLAMIEQSECCIVAADRSKFWRKAFAKISDISVADYLVTNSGYDDEKLAELKAFGINIIN